MEVENREIINEARDRMMEWNAYDWDEQPEAVKQYRDILEDFYDRNNNNPSDTSNFNSRVKLSRDAEEELTDIATAFLNEKETDTDYYERYFDKPTPEIKMFKTRNKITTMEDLVKFLDRMERFKNDALLVTALSSEQIAKLHREADKKHVSDKDLYKMINEHYDETGENNLYYTVWKEIKQKGKKKKDKKEKGKKLTK
jgi:hypothetical protein